MNPRQIEAFRAVARVGVVTAAADLLNISQPAVSRLIAHLEDQLGLELFARHKGRLRLTPEGETFLREVDRHFVGLDALEAAARRIADHGPETLRIVGFPSLASGVLPKAIARHLKRHPGAQLSLDTDTTDRIGPLVAAARYDLGFAAGAGAEGMAAASETIASRAWACVAPPDHPLLTRGTVEAQDLAALPLVAFSPEMSLRQSVDRLFAAAGVVPDYRVAAQTIESICALVAEGSGVAIVHPYATHIARMFGLRTIPIANAAKLDLTAITPNPPFRARVVDEIIDDVRRLIAEEDVAVGD